MRSVIRLMFIASVAAATGPALAQQSLVTLDRLVSIERQKALGLDQLTPEQRAGVVSLLQEAYQLGVQKGQERASDARPKVPGATRTAPMPAVIETRIDGEFSGWEGETIVKLVNGQIWQQTEYHYDYHYAYRPDVLIYSSAGGYRMKVDGVEKAVIVQRLK